MNRWVTNVTTGIRVKRAACLSYCIVILQLVLGLILLIIYICSCYQYSSCSPQSLVGSMVNMLEQSESTRRYATVIRQLLPVVTQVYAAEDPQQAVSTLVTSVLGPYLEKVGARVVMPLSCDACQWFRTVDV